jgi:hypothetical protein
MEWGDGSFSGLDTSQSFRWHQYVKPGTYTLNFDYQDQFEGTMIRCVARFPLADSNVRTVVVHDRAEAQLLVHTNPSFIGHPTAFTVQLDSVYERFLLDFGDNQSIVALADTPFVIHKYHTEGLHFAILTPFFTISQKMPSCPKRDTVLVVILQDSLNSIDEYSTEIKMYPNPTTGTLNIQTQNAIESLRLYSTDGQLVYTKGNAGTDLKLELEFLSSGLYIVEMLVGQQVIRRMVVLR